MLRGEREDMTEARLCVVSWFRSGSNFYIPAILPGTQYLARSFYVKSPRQAGIAPAVWEQSLNLAYRNPDFKVPGTCGLAKMLPTNEPLTRPHATRCSLASTCIYYDCSSVDDVLAAQLCLDTSEAFRLQRMLAGARLIKNAASLCRHGGHKRLF